jgi:2-keto-myo-inositol isomerase
MIQENTMKKIRLCLNRITAPLLSIEEFLSFAGENGFEAVEVRNDLGNRDIIDGLSSSEVRDLCSEYGVQIATINALQRFNDHESTLSDRFVELKGLIDLATKIGIEAVVLCPVNDDPEPRSEDERMKDTIRALKTYGSLFNDSGAKGYVEPLGFEQCSLRFKKNAVDAIEKSGFADCYRLVHDTFHHFLAGEGEFYPDKTGIIHISGVLPGKEKSAIGDADRILVTEDDIMSNKEQLNGFIAAGYTGLYSWEPFSEDVQKTDPGRLGIELEKSVGLLFG